MKLDKNIKIFISVLGIVFFLGQNAQATEECFEKTSRAIFKFNMTLDNYIFEPVAKGYNKLPNPIKTGTSNSYFSICNLHSIYLIVCILPFYFEI